jgi:hypothetical protein
LFVDRNNLATNPPLFFHWNYFFLQTNKKD